jgi:hypothetical protein
MPTPVFEEIILSINSCSSCASSNLATQYAEQLSEKLQDRLRGLETPKPGQSDAFQTDSSATVNTQGEAVGVLVNTSA